MTHPDLEAELWQPLRARPVLIVGFTERTGLATARLLEAHGVRYRCRGAAWNLTGDLFAGDPVCWRRSGARVSVGVFPCDG